MQPLLAHINVKTGENPTFPVHTHTYIHTHTHAETWAQATVLSHEALASAEKKKKKRYQNKMAAKMPKVARYATIHGGGRGATGGGN